MANMRNTNYYMSFICSSYMFIFGTYVPDTRNTDSGYLELSSYFNVVAISQSCFRNRKEGHKSKYISNVFLEISSRQVTAEKGNPSYRSQMLPNSIQLLVYENFGFAKLVHFKRLLSVSQKDVRPETEMVKE